MKNRRRLISVILSIVILVSISVPVMAAPMILGEVNTISRGHFRYYNSFRQERFTERVTVISGNAIVRLSWKINNFNLTCHGTYIYFTSGSTKTLTSGWADHPTSYMPGGISGYAAV